MEHREKAGPTGPRIEAAGYRIRHDKVDTSGSVALRYKGKLHHIGIGCPYAGWRVILLVAGLDVRILGVDGSPLRHLTLDPSVDYQRIPEAIDLAECQLYDVFEISLSDVLTHHSVGLPGFEPGTS